jgi:hypothetical protein
VLAVLVDKGGRGEQYANPAAPADRPISLLDVCRGDASHARAASLEKTTPPFRFLPTLDAVLRPLVDGTLDLPFVTTDLQITNAPPMLAGGPERSKTFGRQRKRRRTTRPDGKRCSSFHTGVRPHGAGTATRPANP